MRAAGWPISHRRRHRRRQQSAQKRISSDAIPPGTAQPAHTPQVSGADAAKAAAAIRATLAFREETGADQILDTAVADGTVAKVQPYFCSAWADFTAVRQRASARCVCSPLRSGG